MLEKAQMMNALEGAIEALPERERMVLQLYYVEGLILKEIVEILGVTESRVSQILSGTVKKLRQQLQIT
jgi:RNA polymerase sigma factor for flagellar operon FliA